VTSAAGMTYESLVADMQTYCERDDSTFIDQIPRLLMIAENKIALTVRNLGMIQYVTSTFSAVGGDNNPIVKKPARWRQTISFNYTNASGKRKYLYPRSYDYCRAYWPNPSLSDLPLYYGDYNYEHWLVVPSVSSAFAFEVAYHERPEPLSSDNQESWTTQYAPQLLLYACLLECQPFLKNKESLAVWKGLYDEEVQGLMGEEKVRAGDDRASNRSQT
jgi:hypothetical protein